MKCKRCKTQIKTWNGDDSVCAFPNGVFDSTNWNCETMSVLRAIILDNNSAVYSDEQNAAIIPYEGEFIVLEWYKNRGATEQAFILNSKGMGPLTQDFVEEFLDKKDALL